MDPQQEQQPQQPVNEPLPGGSPPPQPGINPQVGGMPTSAAPTPQLQQPYQPAAPTQPYPPQQPEHMPSQPESAQSGGRKIWIIVAIVVAVLIVAGVAAYFLFFNQRSNTNQPAGPSVIDLSTLNKVAFNLPDGLDGYTEIDTGDPMFKSFTSTDNNCKLLMGTAPVEELPGADINAIVASQLDNFRSAGGTTNGPTSGVTLIVKDSASSNVTYSLPTLNFELVQGAKRAISHYSAVVLKSGDRMVINRICTNSSGAVDESQLNALDAAAKNVVITKQ